MKKRSLLRISCVFSALFVISFLVTACGKNFYFAGRNLPPSGVLNRVMVAIQNPSPLAQGALQFDDAYYDIRHSFDNKVPLYTIGGFAGKLPITIQNLPEQQLGAVYSEGDGTLALINYAREKQAGAAVGISGQSSSIFITRDGRYVYAANQTSHLLTVADQATHAVTSLSLPGVFRISVNASGTIVLAFIQNSDQVYSVVQLNTAQQQAAIGNPNYNPGLPGSQPAEDCEPQSLPVYCVFPVGDLAHNAGTASFDRPVKAVFSPDGTTAYVLDCGPECGGSAAGLTTIPITAAAINVNTKGAAGIALQAQSNISTAGGATNAVFGTNTLYVAGQQLQPDGLLAGNLTVVNTSNNQATGQYSISDGTHNKMLMGDDNSLWIGSQNCQAGERYKLSQTSGGAATPFGCLTLFNIATNKVIMVNAYKGDATGIAAVTGLHKVYTAEGGQVYIYNTMDGTERDNSNVTVNGTAYDVAYMDAPSDSDNTTY